ncbi:MAG: response regulator transcription factor [Chloroflexota bacterium]|nr:response regulator transcription factor [Chloroflexota bacterium]
MAVRVLIVDDHRIVRQGLQLLLGQDKGLQIVGEASNGQEAIEMARQLNPDVILMDLMMPVMDGIQATAIIRQELPKIEILALTSVMEDASVVEAVRAGAIGYLLKDTEAVDLCQAIKAAAAGQIQLSTQAVARLTRELRQPEAPPKDLTRREMEVLELLVHGRSNREIADCLKVTETTVKSHVSNIMLKLGVHSRTQAAMQAISLGLISTPPPRDDAHDN